MPGREDTRSKKVATPELSNRSKTRADGLDADALRVAELERQCAELTASLATARARIVELETARDSALDRIAWVIDSLHNSLEK